MIIKSPVKKAVNTLKPSRLKKGYKNLKKSLNSNQKMKLKGDIFLKYPFFFVDNLNLEIRNWKGSSRRVQPIQRILGSEDVGVLRRSW